jgi:hypothetical protein
MPEFVKTVWKIRNKETGEFSRGGFGSYHRFDEKGKEWRTKSGLSNHVASASYRVLVEIIEYTVAYTRCDTLSMDEYRSAADDRRRRALAARHRVSAAKRLRAAQEELARAAKECE